MASFRETIKTRGPYQILLLFFLFHLFWLAFYFLSNASFLKQWQWHIYVKFSVINTLGFIAFCLSAYLFFPLFLSSKKYGALFFSFLISIIAFGYAQFLLQDWNPTPFFSKAPIRPPGSSMIVTLQQASGSQIRAMLNILVYLLLGTGFAYMKDWYIKDRRTQSLEKEKVKAELALLRYQLNPHFLFNTINDIYYLAIIKSEKTADAILKVSELLRYVLDHKAETVALSRELQHLDQFMLLQKFRFPDQIVETKFQLREDVDKYEIAPLLLTTFAENAFKHGEPGTEDVPVKISIFLEDGLLKYSVTNKINNQMSKDTTTGIGLNNLRKRLALLYAGRYKLHVYEESNFFHASLELKL